MKHSRIFALLLSLAFVVAAPLARAAAKAEPAIILGKDRSPAEPIATAITTLTGIAISPLLGTGAYGAYQWLSAPNEAARAHLPWFAKPQFWIPALLIVAICAAKDSLGTVLPPGLKKPLDVLETIENKFSGLVAAGAVIPFTLDAMSRLLMNGPDTAVTVTNPLTTGGAAGLPLAAANLTWLLDALTIPFGIAIFAIVWLASHAIHVLILLSPWGAIDAGLKAARTALLGLVTLAATINPWAGAVLSLVVIVVAYFVTGWAFRLTVFGTVFCWDFLTVRNKRFSPAENDNWMFAGSRLAGVPVRTYGRLVQRTEGALEFWYRPWHLLPARRAVVPVDKAALGVGEGMFFSDIVADNGATLFSLPPRYRDHEAVVARAYLFGGGVRPAGIRKAWRTLREMLGGRVVRRDEVAG